MLRLSRVRSIDHVAFESGFPYDRFPSQPSVGAKDRIADASNRKSQHILIPMATQPLSDSDSINAALDLLITSQSTQDTDLSSYSSLSPCIEGSFTVLTILDADDLVDPYSSLLNQLKDVSCADAVLRHPPQPLAQALGVGLDSIQLLRERFAKNEVIARIIGCFPAVTSRDGRLEHSIIVTRQGYQQTYQFDINVWVLNTFLHGEWLCNSGIDGAILPHLSTASHGTQYMSVVVTEEMIRQLRRSAPASKALILNSSTNRLVIPVNVSDSHWCVVMAECFNHHRVVTVYNSAPHIGVSQLERQLPRVIDYIRGFHSQKVKLLSGFSSRKMAPYFQVALRTPFLIIAYLDFQARPRPIFYVNVFHH